MIPKNHRFRDFRNPPGQLSITRSRACNSTFNFARALNRFDLEVPTEMPGMVAISLCS